MYSNEESHDTLFEMDREIKHGVTNENEMKVISVHWSNAYIYSDFKKANADHFFSISFESEDWYIKTWAYIHGHGTETNLVVPRSWSNNKEIPKSQTIKFH